MPAAAFLTDEGLCRQGMSGSTAQGCYVAIPGTGGTPNTAVYFTHDDGTGTFVGPNPGNYDAALAGYTMVEAQIPSGARTAAQQAATLNTALTGTGNYDSVSAASATVTVDGLIDAGAAFTGGSYDAAGGGAITDEVPAIGRILGWTREDPSTAFAIDTARAQRIRPTDVPSGNFRVVGWRVRWGASHVGQIRLALYQGGSGYDYDGATLLADFGPSRGSDTNQWVTFMLDPDDVQEVDPTSGDLWLCWMGDGANSPIVSRSSATAGFASAEIDHDTSDSNRAIWILSGTPPSGSGGTFPASLPARGAAFAFKTAFQLVIQEPPYYGDFAWKSRVGMLQAFAGTGTSTMTGVFTSNAFTSPNVTGVEVDRVFVNYDAHDSGDQFRIEVWEGGTSDTVIDTADLVWDAGQTTGTATGWVAVVDSGSHPLTPNTRMWLSVKAESGGSTIAFGAGGVGYEGFDTPAAFYRGATSESEYTSPDTGFDHDPSVASGDPFSPDGTVINPDNAVGIYAVVRLPGFALTPNP